MRRKFLLPVLCLLVLSCWGKQNLSRVYESFILSYEDVMVDENNRKYGAKRKTKELNKDSELCYEITSFYNELKNSNLRKIDISDSDGATIF